MGYYKPTENYEAKDRLSSGDPDKIVKGTELQADFDAISAAFDDLGEDILDLDYVNTKGDSMTGPLYAPKITSDDLVGGEVTATEFFGDGSNISGITTDQLADVNSEFAQRDDLLIFNGSVWEAKELALADTELNFQGGVDLTDPSQYPTVISDGDLYVCNAGGVADAVWTGIAGKTVNEGNFVGWADSKSQWFLLGDLSTSAVTRVAAGTGIDVDDVKASEPVVSVDRKETDTWYADLGDFNDLTVEVDSITSLWEQNGNDIYYNEGSVGIGTVSPMAGSKLTVKDGFISLDTSGAETMRMQSATGESRVSSSDDLVFRAGGVSAISNDKMRITAAGNVGIGDKTPETFSANAPTLTLKGQVDSKSGAIRYLSSNESVNAYSYADSSNGFSTGTISNHPVRFVTDNAERMRISESGDVSIKGNVTGRVINSTNVNNRGGLFRTTDAVNSKQTALGSMDFYGNSGSSAASLGFGAIGTDKNESFIFRNAKTGGDFTFISPAGVGIGGDPASIGGGDAKLQVAGDAYIKAAGAGLGLAVSALGSTNHALFIDVRSPFPAAKMPIYVNRAGSTGYLIYGSAATSGAYYAYGNANDISIGNSGASGDLKIKSSGLISLQSGNNSPTTDGPASRTVTIDAAGLVGIAGTPGTGAGKIGGGTAKLQVAGDGYFSGTVTATTINGRVTDVPDHVKAITPTQIANWDSGTGGGGSSTIDGRISDSDIVHWNEAWGWGDHATAGYQPAGSYAASNHNHDGVYAPVSHTHAYVPLSGNSTVAGTLTATDFVASSDERLKSDITTAPSVVDQLHGREWTWKEDGKKGSGVIAQELEAVLPHLVHEDDEGMKAVSYQGLVAYLIEEVKGLKREIEALKS